ncbi:unnamed protein product, partial [Nesidiocoris tenuis]
MKLSSCFEERGSGIIILSVEIKIDPKERKTLTKFVPILSRRWEGDRINSSEGSRTRICNKNFLSVRRTPYAVRRTPYALSGACPAALKERVGRGTEHRIKTYDYNTKSKQMTEKRYFRVLRRGLLRENRRKLPSKQSPSVPGENPPILNRALGWRTQLATSTYKLDSEAHLTNLETHLKNSRRIRIRDGIPCVTTSRLKLSSMSPTLREPSFDDGFLKCLRARG